LPPKVGGIDFTREQEARFERASARYALPARAAARGAGCATAAYTSSARAAIFSAV
jgi:hypothetical protein